MVERILHNFIGAGEDKNDGDDSDNGAVDADDADDNDANDAADDAADVDADVVEMVNIKTNKNNLANNDDKEKVKTKKLPNNKDYDANNVMKPTLTTTTTTLTNNNHKNSAKMQLKIVIKEKMHENIWVFKNELEAPRRILDAAEGLKTIVSEERVVKNGTKVVEEQLIKIKLLP
uniref:Uncharacterized protein n=1 Tax=Ceratitis capitata TaxID=7213 RepID=W8BH90_CERCA